LNLPPLRQRMEDIPDLAPVFLTMAAERLGKNFESLEPDLISKFQHYDWPGNVRELKQVVERLAIHYDGPIMRADWWDPPLEVDNDSDSPFPGAWGGSGAFPGQPMRRGHSMPPFPSGGNQNGPQPPQDWPYHYSQPPQQPSAARSPQPHRPMNRKEKQKLAAQLIEESDGELTWVAAQIGVHPTTLYRWRKAGKV